MKGKKLTAAQIDNYAERIVACVLGLADLGVGKRLTFAKFIVNTKTGERTEVVARMHKDVAAYLRRIVAAG